MASTLAFNPYGTSQPQDSFLLQTQGLMQGLVCDDPASRLWLMGGLLGTADSIPMWGGVPINEMINVANAQADGLGPVVNRSTTQGTVTISTGGAFTWPTFSGVALAAGDSVRFTAPGTQDTTGSGPIFALRYTTP